jgi:hypothetical protein
MNGCVLTAKPLNFRPFRDGMDRPDVQRGSDTAAVKYTIAPRPTVKSRRRARTENVT